MHGLYGTLDAEFEVQRTTKRAELTAFLCLLRRTVGRSTAHVENKGIIHGLWEETGSASVQLSLGRRHGETLVVPLSILEGSQEPDP